MTLTVTPITQPKQNQNTGIVPPWLQHPPKPIVVPSGTTVAEGVVEKSNPGGNG